MSSIDAFIGPDPRLSWPTVQADVLGIEWLCKRRLWEDATWWFNVRFRYRVGESGYSGEQSMRSSEIVPLALLREAPFYCDAPYGARDAPSELSAVEEAWEYHVGQPVLVYYNPNNPAEAVIRPGLVFGAIGSYGFFIALLTTPILASVGIGSLIAGIRRLRK